MKKVDFKDINLLQFGNEIQTVGMVMSDRDSIYLIEYPAASFTGKDVKQIVISEGQWQDLLNQLDSCQVEVNWAGKKATFRKCQRVIDNFICWKVYKRDGYTCRYCGRNDVPLTVDHVILWEEGGQSVEENLITCCKPCNRERGRMQYDEWLKSSSYKKLSQGLDDVTFNDNARVVEKLDYLKTLKGAVRTKRK